MKKKLLASILATLCAAATVTGCGGGNNGSSSGSGEAGAALKDENIVLDGTLPIIKDPSKAPKLSMVIISSATRVVPPAELEMVQRLGEETGVYFEWQDIMQEGATEKINLMLSASTLPDAFWTFGDGKSGNMAVQYSNQDIFMPTEDLIENYMPRLKEILEKRPEYKKAIVAPDGHTYGFPYIEEMKGLVLTPGPFMINKNWLDQVGKEVPATVDEWVDCLKAFRDGGDLNGNGKADELPTAIGFGATDTFGSYNIFYRFTGAFGEADSYCGGNNYADHLRVVNDEVVFTAGGDAFRKTANFFHDLYQEGLIDPDSFSLGTSSATPLFIDKLKQDVALIGSFGVWGDQEVTNLSVHDEYVPLPRLQGEAGMTGFALNYSQMQDTSDVAITTDCQYPEVIAAFVDYCYEPKNSILLNWGPLNYYEDTDGILRFNLDETGNIITKEPYNDFGEMRLNSTPARGSMAVLDEYYDTVAEYTYDAKNLLAYQIVNGKEDILKEYTTVPKMLMTTEELTKLAQIQPTVSDTINRYISQWVMEGNADATWDTYLKELDSAGLQDILSIFNAAYTRYKNA